MSVLTKEELGVIKQLLRDSDCKFKSDVVACLMDTIAALQAENAELARKLQSSEEIRHAEKKILLREVADNAALREALDSARRETASDPDSRWCRNATIILDAALAHPEAGVPTRVVYTSCAHPTYTDSQKGDRTCSHCGARLRNGKWEGGSMEALNAKHAPTQPEEEQKP